MPHLDAPALAAYQDDGLEPAERELARAHLAVCAACRDRLGAQLRATAGREDAGASVAAAIGARPDGGVRREYLAAAAIGALLLGVGLWWALDGPGPERTAGPSPREATPSASPAPDPSAGELAGPAGNLPDPAGAAAGPETGGEPTVEPPADTASGAVDPALLALRGGARQVDGKTFRLRGDEWVDDAWTHPPGRPPIRLVRGTATWRAALAERPALARYAEVGPRVLVVVDSLAFRIEPAP